MRLFKKSNKEEQMSQALEEAKNDGKKKRELQGAWKYIASTFAMLITIFHIVGLTVYPMDPFMFRAVSLLSIAALSFMMVPPTKNANKNRPVIYDYVCIAVALSVMVYVIL